MSDLHRQWLKELTSLPTAAGCESRVIQWIHTWIQARPALVVEEDRFGNLTVRKRQARSKQPLYFTAHLDHPAFVVRQVHDANTLTAEFRGGVNDEYFPGAGVRWYAEDGSSRAGVVEPLHVQAGQTPQRWVKIHLSCKMAARVGEVLTWNLPAARIRGDRLHAPACDDLAGVAAALSAMDSLLHQRGRRQDVRLLFTRAEEIGFVGAIGACQSRTMPRSSRVVALECSRSYAESPVGGGPIVRVGDRTSTFAPTLTYRIAQIAAAIATGDPSFRWQRRLMPGGTCEATVYQEFGYEATCLCLPLQNYHNMTGPPMQPPVTSRAPRAQSRTARHQPAKIGAEIISLGDFANLVRLLVHVGQSLDDTTATPSLRRRLEGLFDQGRHVLEER